MIRFGEDVCRNHFWHLGRPTLYTRIASLLSSVHPFILATPTAPEQARLAPAQGTVGVRTDSLLKLLPSAQATTTFR